MNNVVKREVDEHTAIVDLSWQYKHTKSGPYNKLL